MCIVQLYTVINDIKNTNLKVYKVLKKRYIEYTLKVYIILNI